MLKKRAEFLRVARGRRKSAMPGLVLQAAKWRGGAMTVQGAAEGAVEGDRGANDNVIRVGYTASRKVGNAVARNRARRRLRAAVAQVMSQAQPGTDYVVIARQGTLKRPFAALTTDLETALKRLHAWRAADQA